MEKPKNYWLTAKIAIITAFIFLLFAIYPVLSLIFSLSFFFSLFVIWIFCLLIVVLSVLCLTNGIKFKDWRYIFLAVILIIIIPLGYILFTKVGSNVISTYHPTYY